MAPLFRFGVSLEKDLLDRFDKHIRGQNYTNRSEAFRDLIRQELVKKQWDQESEIAGAITLIYNHHKRELMNKLTDIQHNYHKLIIATQHIHLDHHNCLEIIVVRGTPKEAHELSNNLKSLKGVKHGTLSMSSTGKEIE